MNDPFDTFTNHLKTVLTRALCLALETGKDSISPAHLLWAVASEQGSVGAEILKKAGVNIEKLEKYVGINGQHIMLTSSQAQKTPKLSSGAKDVIDRALLSAKANEHHHIGTEHLLLGILQARALELEKFWEQENVKPEVIVSHLSEAFQKLKKQTIKKTEEEEREQALNEPCAQCGQIHNSESQTALQFFTVELTNQERVKKIDDLIGREKEIERLATILTRRTKNNPLLLGEPGVGKTAIVEGLAKKILNKTAPKALHDKKIHLLDMAGLIAGAMYRGDFEARLTEIIEEVKERNDIILFIDELHTIIGAGSNGGSLDAANILKPALARGELRLIGATTHGEYKKHLETDGALARRFVTLSVKEPNKEETLEILKGLLPAYEKHHQVNFHQKAVEAIVNITERYFPHKTFPDKAIDLLDEAASAFSSSLPSVNHQAKIDSLTQKITEVRKKLKEAAEAEDFILATTIKEEEQNLLAQKKDYQTKATTSRGEISEQFVYQIAANISGIPLAKLSIDDKSNLLSLPQKLAKHVIAQETAIQAISDAVTRAKLGLTNPDRPLASLLFVGPSGVGKTELAKALSQEIFGDKKHLIRLDMSEYAEAHTVSKLIGSPAGYVGYKEEAKLLDAVKKQPYSVILLDELEKAHKDVHGLLLQLLDEGTLSDGAGNPINFRNTIIVMTTNAGKDRFERGALGFGSYNSPTPNNEIQTILEESFKPELINRIGTICLFSRLDEVALRKILEKELKELTERLKKQGIKLTISKTVAPGLVKKINSKLGARQVKKLIEEEIEKKLAQKILLSQPKAQVNYKINYSKQGVIQII